VFQPTTWAQIFQLAGADDADNYFFIGQDGSGFSLFKPPV
jgi:hypothetical protein